MVQVLTHQLKVILGVKTTSRGSVLEIVYLVYDISRNIPHTNLMQLLISVTSITALLLVKQCINERFKYVCHYFKDNLRQTYSERGRQTDTDRHVYCWSAASEAMHQ